MSTATPSDVRGVIETSLESAEIQSYLDDATYENELANDVAAMDTETIRQIETRLAAIKILTLRQQDRAVTNESLGSANKSYEVGMVSQLRRELAARDPSGTLVRTVQHDTDRTVSTTTTSSVEGAEEPR